MAYDAATKQVVLFGGASASGTLLNDTWLWNGSGWSQFTPNPKISPTPPAEEGAAMAYDANLRELILFGGETQVSDPPTLSNQTWAWNGGAWYQLVSAQGGPPPARYGAILSGDDSGSGQFVLFGGTGVADGGTAAVLGDTWTFDGTTWHAQSPPTSPPARTDAAATWDGARSEVVMFGGQGSQGSGNWLGDTWTWKGFTWSQVKTASSPTARADTTLSWDGDVMGDVLFGGQAAAGLLADTWSFDGANWAPLGPSNPPGPRSRAASSWDGSASHLLMFGGAAGGGAIYGDTDVLIRAAPGTSPAGSTTTTVRPAPPAAAKRPITVPGTHLTAPTTTSPSRSLTTTNRSPRATAPTRTSSSPTTVAHPTPPLVAKPDTVHDGEKVALLGGGFAPGAAVMVSFHSDPVVVGSARADSFGRFSLTVTVPTTAPTGAHHFQATGMGTTGAVVTLATAVSVIPLQANGNGRSVTETLVMVALALVIPGLTWLGLSLHSRRRRRAGLQA
jgi:hypothetical protein